MRSMKDFLIHKLLRLLFVLRTTTQSHTHHPSPQLIVLLHAHGGHAVDDGVTARVHVPHGQGDGQDGQSQDNTQPQDNVEDGRVVRRVVLVQVGDVRLARQIKCKQRRFHTSYKVRR